MTQVGLSFAVSLVWRGEFEWGNVDAISQALNAQLHKPLPAGPVDRTGQSAWFSTNLISEYWIIHRKVLWLLAWEERKGFINICTYSISASCLPSSRAYLLTLISWRLLFTRTSGMQTSTLTFSFSPSMCKLWVLVFKFSELALISLMCLCLDMSLWAMFGLCSSEFFVYFIDLLGIQGRAEYHWWWSSITRALLTLPNPHLLTEAFPGSTCKCRFIGMGI